VAALPERGDAPSRDSIARGLIALVALLLVVWFVILARDQSIGTSTSHQLVTAGGLSPSEWRAAERDFARTHLLDPSTDWSLVQAQYQLLYDRPAAMRGAEAILRREPDNLAAWWVLLKAAKGLDTARYERAVSAIRRLNPNPEAN
jgi:hypothetical protein